MKLVILHPDDYGKAVVNGMIPFDVDEDRSGDKVRVGMDPFVPVSEGEAVVIDVRGLPSLMPGPKLVFPARVVELRA